MGVVCPITVLTGGSVSIKAGVQVCWMAVIAAVMAEMGVVVGSDVDKDGRVGAPAHEVMIRLRIRIKFRVRRKRRLVIIMPQRLRKAEVACDDSLYTLRPSH